MKNINKILATALMSVALVGCNELDTEYEGGLATSDQKGNTLAAKPELALAGVTGISANSSVYMGVTGGHDDFGYPGLMLLFDHLTQDMPARNVGYNWFNAYQAYVDFDKTADAPSLIWYNMYKQINSANNVLQTIPADTDNPELMMYRAQALGFRAFDYWVLAQSFARTYYGNQTKPCVPIITEENQIQVAAEGCARNTVQEVYDKILADLNTAIENCEASGLSVNKLLDVKSRRLLNLDALYGLRARVYLTMHEYAKAAEDARKAIEVSSCTPLTIAEVSKPGFNGFDHAWMWGIAIAETDRVVTSGIVNFPSHMCSFAYGYVTVGAWRTLAQDVFAVIPASDVRKGWWLDENYTSPNVTDAQLEYLYSFGEGSIKDTKAGILPFTNVKFDSYQSVLGTSTNASDIPLMRIEEMYYILAEGLAMSGNTGEALSVLTNFEKTYRNPSFSTSAATADEIQNVIWNKRRIEFWGEGLSWFDVKRLNKGIDRTKAGYPDAFIYQLDPDNDVLAWIFPIPETEITANKLISENQNNPTLSRPLPVK
ncbi:MAG: RagB/SusD family nutrient uptake outer membrane protein [Muribaculaceae bacterium]